MVSNSKTVFRFFYYVVFSLFLGFSTVLTANASLAPPQKIIFDLSEKLKQKLKEPDFAQNPNRVAEYIKQELFPHVDAFRMSALVLGKHWRTATKQQKLEFTREFRDLQVRTYSSAFTTQFQDWTIKFLPLNLKESAKKAVVKTHILQPGKPPVNVDYYMAKRKGQWKIYDVKIEGISMVITNRNTFSEMIKQKGSLDAVIAELKKKNQSNASLNS
jgi:phospholipid transport system substrate-binding protein